MRQNSSREVFSTTAKERRTGDLCTECQDCTTEFALEIVTLRGGGVRVRDEDDDVTQLKCLNLLHPSSASEKMRFFRLVSSVLCRQIKVHTS